MARNFRELRAKIASNPEARAEIEEYKRGIYDALALAEMRQASNMTQTQMAETLSTTQRNVSRIEHEDDLYVSTLSRYVEALGGHLDLTAVFPDRTVHLNRQVPA